MPINAGRKTGVIVSGESLLKIFANEKLLKKFIELADSAEVVLACRVSPKQKAELVAMIRKEHEEAITLGIGDGANDVNMICEAHVGVGIQGLEGMQAARSSDYAIAQFSYLKSLLFFHGREAYRRNSILAIYMFYKNILFVMPQFWYGFTSAFSGQTLYEPILYQFYNVSFTAFPIMIFAILDQEYVRERFMTDPSLYIIGLTNEYFNTSLVTRTILKGMFNGLLMILFVFHGLNGGQIGSYGKNGDLWVSGTLVYAIVVVNANLFVMQRTSSHTWWSSIFLILSVASFYACFYFESLYPWSGPLYHLWDHAMYQKRIWIVFLLAFWQNTALDMMFSRWRKMKQTVKLEEIEAAKMDNRVIEDSFHTDDGMTESQPSYRSNASQQQLHPVSADYRKMRSSFAFAK